MLKIENIAKTFNENTINEKKVFNSFSLTVNNDDFITIIGSNGAGKSTLLNIISGNLGIDEGEIYLDDNKITNTKEYRRAKKISRVYQNPLLGTSPSLNILENLSMVYNKNKSYGLSFAINNKNKYLFIDILKKLNLGLENQLYTKVGLLSGGQRQALSLIMATISKPDILLLDEHTAALDPHTSKTIMDITENIINENHIPTLMVTHNMDDALKYGNRLIMMDNGKIIFDVSNEEKKNLTPLKLIEYFKKEKINNFSDRTLLN